MNFQQEADFYKELCKGGISVNSKNNEFHVIIPTGLKKPEDDHSAKIEHFLLDVVKHTFSDETEALKFAKELLINNGYKEIQDKDKSDEDKKKLVNFSVYAMMDLGFGVQNIALGEFSVDCQEDNWYESLMSIAADEAKTYLKNKYPEKDFEKVPKQIKIVPA